MAIQLLSGPSRLVAQVQTTNATVTTMTQFAITIGNKQVELYEGTIYAVRDSTAGPVVGVWKMNCTCRISPSTGLGEMPTGGSGSANPNVITKSFSDTGMVAAFWINGSNQISIQVTGLASTTIDWMAVVDQTIFNST